MTDREKLVAWLQAQGVAVLRYAWANHASEIGTLNALCEAPFADRLGIHFDNFEIHCTDETPWWHLLHEAGHLLATHNRPWASKEYEFLGWEFALIDHLRLSWDNWWQNNGDYLIAMEYGGRSYEAVRELRIFDARDAFRLDRLTRAAELGLVKGTQPVNVRTPRKVA